MRTMKRANKMLLVLLALVFILTLWIKPVSAAGAPFITIPIEQLFEVKTKDPGSYVAKPLRSREVNGNVKSKVEVNDTFHYTLKAADVNNPMPTGSTGNIYTFALKGTQVANIGPIIYETTGHYKYEIAQIIPEQPGDYMLDKQVYKIDVYVKEKTSQGLYVQTVMTNGEGRKRSTLRFVNQFAVYGTQEESTQQSYPNQQENISTDSKTTERNKPSDRLSDIQTGDTSNLAIWGMLILVAGSGIIWVFATKGQRKSQKQHK